MPRRSAFSRAASAASGERSEAVTRRSGRSLSRARAIAPEPVPTSCTRAPSGSSAPTSTSSSVSRRGISTRSSTAISISRKRRVAEDVGQRLAFAAARDQLARSPRATSGVTSPAPSRSKSSTSIASAFGDQRFGVGARRPRSPPRRSSPLPASARDRRAGARQLGGAPSALWLLHGLASHRYGALMRLRVAAPTRDRGHRVGAAPRAIQIAPATIIARLSSWAVVRPSATASLRRRNSTRKRSAPA